MKVRCLVRNGVDALEVCVTSDVMQLVPGVDFSLLRPAEHRGDLVLTSAGLRIAAPLCFEEPQSSGCLIVLGGAATNDAELARRIRASHGRTELLVAAGDGQKLIRSAGFPLPEVDPTTRIGRRDGVWIGPGSTGIFDLMLSVVAARWGVSRAQLIQLVMEYDPPVMQANAYRG